MNILDDKQYKHYEYFSRYESVPYYYHKLDQKYVYGTTSHIKDNTSYILHEVKLNDTLDTLALDYYNNPTFFWVIADFNHIQDPYKKLDVGSKLKIPVLNEVAFEEMI